MDWSGSHFIRVAGIVGVALGLALSSCGKSPTRPPGGGRGAAQITTVAPENDAQNLPLRVELEWVAPDSVSSSVRYDIYLGRGSADQLMRSGVVGVRFLTDPLKPASDYQWRVVAREPGGKIMNTRINSFSTSQSNKESVQEFPLRVDSRWTANRKIFTTNIRPDSLSGSFSDTNSFLVTTEVIAEGPAMGLENLFHIQSDESGIFGDCVDTSYMHLEDETLFSLDMSTRCSFGVVPLRGTVGGMIEFRGERFTTLPELARRYLTGGDLSVIARSAAEGPILRSLELPLEVGDHWTYRTPEMQGAGWRIDKIVIGFQTVTVPAGEFKCAVISWLYDFDNDGIWNESAPWVTEYVSDSGLVQRVIRANDLTIRRQDGTSVANGDGIDEVTLESFSLP